jgi:Transposase, Mutator family
MPAGARPEIFGVIVGRDLISRVTDAVMDDARAWQTRPLEDVYPVVFLDCIVLKIRDGGTVQRHTCYLAMAIGTHGEREALGMWFHANEGVGAGGRLTPLRRLRFDPSRAVAEASGALVSLARLCCRGREKERAARRRSTTRLKPSNPRLHR